MYPPEVKVRTPSNRICERMRHVVPKIVFYGAFVFVRVKGKVLYVSNILLGDV